MSRQRASCGRSAPRASSGSVIMGATCRPWPTLCSQNTGHSGHTSRLISTIVAMLRSARRSGRASHSAAPMLGLASQRAAEDRQARAGHQERRPLAIGHGGEEWRREQHADQGGVGAVGIGQQADRDPGEQRGRERIGEGRQGKRQQQRGQGE